MGASRFIVQVRSVVVFAARSLVQSAALHGLSIGIIALCLTALGTTQVILLEVGRVVAAWNQERVVTAFLPADVDDARVDAIMAAARGDVNVLDVRRVGPAESRARLGAALGARADMLEDLDASLLPRAVEAELVPGTSPESTRALAAMLSAMPGVDEVAFGEEEMGRLQAVVGLLRAGALFLAALIALVSVLIISNTLKLTVLARRDEIEIMRLVGAGDAFVRAPFVLEGAIQGLAGSALATGMLLGLHGALALQAQAFLSGAFGSAGTGGPPWEVVGTMVVLGTLLGVVGGIVGTGRFPRS